MNQLELRHKIRNRPPCRGPGEIAFYTPRSFVRSKHEIAVSMFFITNRSLFGMAYSHLQPEYFYSMPRGSGVYVAVAPSAQNFTTEIARPGDVDLLVIPYEQDMLLTHRSMAIEVKVIRASFTRQGKSPNEFGFTQAAGLKSIGFPYVAVAHLIVSDSSPEEAWREVNVARIIDRSGRAEMLDPVLTDCLPMDLMDRAFGRLKRVAKDSDVGLVTAYVKVPGFSPRGGPSFWPPDARPAAFNALTRESTLHRIAEFFDKNSANLLDNPRFDPPP